jgi:hypothetical protein
MSKSNKNKTTTPSVVTMAEMVAEGRYSSHKLRDAIIRYYGGMQKVPRDSRRRWLIPTSVRDKVYAQIGETERLAEEDMNRVGFVTMAQMAEDGKCSASHLRAAIIQYYGDAQRVPRDSRGRWQIPIEVRNEVYAKIEAERNQANKTGWIHLSDDIYEAVERKAKASGQTINDVVKNALRDDIADETASMKKKVDVLEFNIENLERECGIKESEIRAIKRSKEDTDLKALVATLVAVAGWCVAVISRSQPK